MTLIISILKKFIVIITFASFTFVNASAETLTNMVNQILDSHEDIVNAKKELEESKTLFKKYNWPSIDVTRKSVEETAASIIKIIEIKKNQ